MDKTNINLIDFKPLEISFTLTHMCNLGCTYCYEKNKNNKKMTKETIDKAMDFFISHPYYGQAKNISIEFFGGEPFLEWELMKYVMDTFPKKIVEKKPEWLGHIEFHTTTNATLLNDKKIQDFIKEYPELGICISIDGDETSHNENRKYLNGNGSFNDVCKSLKFLRELERPISIKGTMSKETLHNLGDSLIWQMQNGFKKVWINPIFEEDWTEEDGKEYYKQLCKAIDYRFDNNLEYEISRIGTYREKECEGTCCGTGSYCVSVDTDGTLYPCSRLMYGKYTYPIGNINTDVDLDKLTEFIFMCADFDESKDKSNHCCYAYCYANNGCMKNEYAPKTWIMEKYAVRAGHYENMRRNERELGWETKK